MQSDNARCPHCQVTEGERHVDTCEWQGVFTYVPHWPEVQLSTLPINMLLPTDALGPARRQHGSAADLLTAAIARQFGVDFGVHGQHNNPWRNALAWLNGAGSNSGNAPAAQATTLTDEQLLDIDRRAFAQTEALGKMGKDHTIEYVRAVISIAAPLPPATTPAGAQELESLMHRILVAAANAELDSSAVLTIANELIEPMLGEKQPTVADKINARHALTYAIKHLYTEVCGHAPKASSSDEAKDAALEDAAKLLDKKYARQFAGPWAAEIRAMKSSAAIAKGEAKALEKGGA